MAKQEILAPETDVTDRADMLSLARMVFAMSIKSLLRAIGFVALGTFEPLVGRIGNLARRGLFDAAWVAPNRIHVHLLKVQIKSTD